MIDFYNADREFPAMDQSQLRSWLTAIAEEHEQSVERITYLFCSDSYMLKANRHYLSHDYFTDILTFPYYNPKGIEADVLISVDRVKDNAQAMRLSFDTELQRVLLHGLLHLLGYRDDTYEDKKEMRLKEDHYLSKRNE